MLQAGELKGTKEPLSDRWRIPQHAVHARLESHKPREPREASVSSAELMERVETLAMELGHTRGRLELTEKAESTLREDMERERARADRLEEELRAERSKGFWARLFGG
jgi:hypothetical protein